MTVQLSFARASIELGEGTFSERMLTERLRGFRPRSQAGMEPGLRLSRASSNAGTWEPFTGAVRIAGGYRTIANEVVLHPSVDDRGALLALRILFAKAIEAQRGVLVHASCVEYGGAAALATGASGAGKSTIARWAQKAGATLLSDEVVGLLPDGQVLGTPFFSDSDLIGTAREGRLSVAMTLQHGESESFRERPAHELVRAICEQTFSRTSGIVARDALVRVATAVSGSRTGVFTCRNAPSAGIALVELLA